MEALTHRERSSSDGVTFTFPCVDKMNFSGCEGFFRVLLQLDEGVHAACAQARAARRLAGLAWPVPARSNAVP